jgi:3-deoxy-D-manno-octulosonate 8-phosphate phosphatase (KDO 8-P phosphatase)
MARISFSVRKKAENIKLLLLDVDGVLTDGKIIIDDRGFETKHFHVRDGQGINLLMRAGIDVGFITGRSSKVVAHRAKELGVRIVQQGVQDKLGAYMRIKSKARLNDQQVAYVGDDIIDLPIMDEVGLAVAVADCWPGLLDFADFVTAAKGGAGAVREVAELLLQAQGKWMHPGRSKRTQSAKR